MELQPLESSAQLTEAIYEVETNQPYMLHIRLTDYLNEDAIGIPSIEYYSRGIEILFEKSGSRPIWVFSDDIDKAVEYLPKKYADYYVISPHLDKSSHTFELMRSFAGYVIANSTYSWWAAFLRYNREVPVIAPKPWFRDGTIPLELLPEDWIPIEALKK